MWKVIGLIIWFVTPRVMKIPPWQNRKLLLETHALQTKCFRQWQKYQKLVRAFAKAVQARLNAAQNPNSSTEMIEKLTRQEEKCYEAVVVSELLYEELRVDAQVASVKFLNTRSEQILALVEKERERQILMTPAERLFEEKWTSVREDAKAARIAKLEELLDVEKIK